jgi:hypothetical protein
MLGKTVAALFDLAISAKIRHVFMSLLVNCCLPGCMGLAKSKHGGSMTLQHLAKLCHQVPVN